MRTLTRTKIEHSYKNKSSKTNSKDKTFHNFPCSLELSTSQKNTAMLTCILHSRNNAATFRAPVWLDREKNVCVSVPFRNPRSRQKNPISILSSHIRLPHWPYTSGGACSRGELAHFLCVTRTYIMPWESRDTRRKTHTQEMNLCCAVAECVHSFVRAEIRRSGARS